MLPTLAHPPLVDGGGTRDRGRVHSPLHPPAADRVATALDELTAQQHRVAGALAAIGQLGRWEVRLATADRDRLVRLGHFLEYGAELDWTPREVAGHLRDSAEVFTERILRLRAEHEPALPDFDTTAPERLADYSRTPPDRLLRQLAEAQQVLCAAVAEIGGEELRRRGVHEVDGPMTLADVLAFLPGHQADHAEQLDALRGRAAR